MTFEQLSLQPKDQRSYVMIQKNMQTYAIIFRSLTLTQLNSYHSTIIHNFEDLQIFRDKNMFLTFFSGKNKNFDIIQSR